MKKIFDCLYNLLELSRDRKFYKQLRSGRNGVMQIKLDYEHLSPTTSSIHFGSSFDHRSVQYIMPDEKPFFEKIGHNYW